MFGETGVHREKELGHHRRKTGWPDGNGHPGCVYWVPQRLLLARQDGGQGLVHLASGTVTFRLQFIQKYLTDSIYGGRLDVSDNTAPGMMGL